MTNKIQVAHLDKKATPAKIRQLTDQTQKTVTR